MNSDSLKIGSKNKYNTKWLFAILSFLYLLYGGNAKGQTLTLTEVLFKEYAIFYVSSFDLQTGAMGFDWFEYLITAESYPVDVSLEFEVRINSPSLGIDHDLLIWREVSDTFSLEGTVRIRNTDMDSDHSPLVYTAGALEGQRINVPIDTMITIPTAQWEAIFSSIIQTGRLPDGSYNFLFKIIGPENIIELDKTIVLTNQIFLRLISPGGWLEDIENNIVMTTYPIFQWEYDSCAVCSVGIRVARFDPDEHSSVYEAIESQTVLPFEQSAVWYDISGINSFQYPESAVDLMPGNIYVWQLRKTIPTTAGDLFIISPILAFKIAGRPQNILLGDNYPNPFRPNPSNPATEISFSLAKEMEINLVVIDISGQQVAILGSGLSKPGRYKVVWDGRRSRTGEQVASGIYFYRLETENSTKTKKMLLLK